MAGRWFRRRWLVGALLVAVLALAGASQGLAGAQADGSATVPVFRHVDPFAKCPPQSNKSIGTAQFTLKNSILTVQIKLRGADPGTYSVALWTAKGPCAWTGNFYGKFKVDASGDGSVSFSTAVSNTRKFYVDVYNTDVGQSNASAVANL